MAIFNSKLLNYQRVYGKSLVFLPKPQVLSSKPMSLHTAGERHPRRRELRNLFQPGCSPWSSRAPRPVCEASPGRVFWGQWDLVGKTPRSNGLVGHGMSWCSWNLSLSVLKKCQQAPTRSPKVCSCLKVKWFFSGWKGVEMNGYQWRFGRRYSSWNVLCVKISKPDVAAGAAPQHPEQSASAHCLSSRFIGLAASVHALIQLPVHRGVAFWNSGRRMFG